MHFCLKYLFEFQGFLQIQIAKMTNFGKNLQFFSQFYYGHLHVNYQNFGKQPFTDFGFFLKKTHPKVGCGMHCSK